MIDAVSDRADFQALRSSPHRGSSGPVLVTVVRRPGADRPAVAFALPRRLGPAVRRNRARRRVRAICWELLHLGGLPVNSYLFTFRHDLSSVDHTTLRGHVARSVATAVEKSADNASDRAVSS